MPLLQQSAAVECCSCLTSIMTSRTYWLSGCLPSLQIRLVSQHTPPNCSYCTIAADFHPSRCLCAPYCASCINGPHSSCHTMALKFLHFPAGMLQQWLQSAFLPALKVVQSHGQVVDTPLVSLVRNALSHLVGLGTKHDLAHGLFHGLGANLDEAGRHKLAAEIGRVTGEPNVLSSTGATDPSALFRFQSLCMLFWIALPIGWPACLRLCNCTHFVWHLLNLLRPVCSRE